MSFLLSPEALAVWQAFEQDEHGDLAAAIGELADQVVPDDSQEAMHFTTEAIRLNKQGIRRQLLAIAAELETLDD